MATFNKFSDFSEQLVSGKDLHFETKHFAPKINEYQSINKVNPEEMTPEKADKNLSLALGQN